MPSLPRRAARQVTSDESPVVEPDVEQLAPALTHALRQLTGRDVSLVGPPTPRFGPDGPGAFGFELAAGGGALPEEWQGTLIARVSDHPEDLAREQQVLTFLARHELGVPRVLALVDLEMPAPIGPAPAASHALVLQAAALEPLSDVIQFNLTESGTLSAGLIAYHVRVHQLDPCDLADEIPLVSLEEELKRIDPRGFAKQLDWLQQHAPPPGPAVLCHGAFNPLCVAAPGPDEWQTDGDGLVVSGWMGAFLGEREVDMAITLAMYYLAPHFAPNRPGRTAMRMIRNVLSNEYRTGYAARVPVDAKRLMFWQAFHAVRALARIAGAYDEDGSPFATADRQPLPASLASELERLYQRSVASAG
jgi:hypothetical protein